MYIMEIAKLNSKNFLDYAIQNYRNPECRDIEEYLKRLFSRYDQDNDFKCRLVVNHLIVFSNVFGDVPSCRILFFKVEEKYHHILKTCLEYMNILPDDIPELDISAIPLDIKILKKLETEI